MGAIAAIAGLLFGFDTGVISGAQEFLFPYFNLKDNNLQDAATRGLIVACVPIGALLGAMVSGFFAHRLGRRRTLLMTAIMFFNGAIVAALAPHLYSVGIGRLVMGLAIGISAMVAPMYLAEVSPPKIRGSMIFLFQLAITIGIFSAFAINLWFGRIFEPTVSWRYMFGAGVIPATIFFLGMLGLPKSPRWLMLKNRFEEAKAVMQRLLGRYDVDAEMNEMRESCSREQGNWITLFKKPLLPLLCVAFGLFVFQQLSGINAVMYYGPEIFSKAGFGADAKFLAQLCIGIINVLSTIFGVWIVDKSGRRPLLLVGFIGLIICLGGLSFCLKAEGLHPFVCLSLTLLYVVFFAISLGGVPYILMSELFPLKVRSVGMAIASCANWGFNMMVAFSFKPLTNLLGNNIGNVFVLYTICTVFGFLFAYRFVPETKGRHLEALEENLYEGKELSQLGQTVEVRE